MSIVAVAVLTILIIGSFDVKEEHQASVDVMVDENKDSGILSP